MTGAALWTPPTSFCVAGAALSTCGDVTFVRIALSGLRQLVNTCKFRGRCCIFGQMMKIDGSLAQNIDFDVANFALHEKNRRKTSIFQVQSVKSGWSLVRNARFQLSTCLSLDAMVLWWCPRANRESCKTCLLCPFQRMWKWRFAGQAWDFVTLSCVCKTCRTSFCVTGAILLKGSQKMSCKLLWQAQRFGDFHLHFAWQAQHFSRVEMWVFCRSHCQGCVKWRKRAKSVESVAFLDKWWKWKCHVRSVPPKSVSQECLPNSVKSVMPRVSSQECQVRSVFPRVSPRSVFPRVSCQKCLPRRVPQECLPKSVFPRGSFQECHAKSVMPRVSSQEDLSKSVMPRVPRVSCQECLPKRVFPRVSCQECLPIVSPKSVSHSGSWVSSCLVQIMFTSIWWSQVVNIFQGCWHMTPPKGNYTNCFTTNEHKYMYILIYIYIFNF